MKKIYFIGVGGIGISAVARYYNENNWQVLGSDLVDSNLIHKLISEGIDVLIGEDAKRITPDIDFLVYSNSIPEDQVELARAKEIGIKCISYPEALAEIVNEYKLIAVAGSHGKSTTSSMISIMINNSIYGINAVIGSIIKEFDDKNCYFSNSEYFVIEACEYKRAFLNYKPYIGIITNIDLDHLDYFKGLDDYEAAFKSFVYNIQPGGIAILNGDCESSNKLFGLRKDVYYIKIHKDHFEVKNSLDLKSFFSKNPFFKNVHIGPKEAEDNKFPDLELQVPGEQMLFDAHVAYIVGNVIGLSNFDIKHSLENYKGIWRRSEIIGTTSNGNILMSDYGHHPTEIKATLNGLKSKYPDKKLFVAFQPHQYARTLSLLDDFKNCFKDADFLIVPDIYESRDSEEDKAKINSAKFVELINHPKKFDGNGLENTLKYITRFDSNNPNTSIILLMGAGDIDNLRYKIEIESNKM